MSRGHRVPPVLDPAAVNIGATTMGYASALLSAAASMFRRTRNRSRSSATALLAQRPHSSIGNAVYNKHDGVIIVVDNFYSSATAARTFSPRALAM